MQEFLFFLTQIQPPPTCVFTLDFAHTIENTHCITLKSSGYPQPLLLLKPMKSNALLSNPRNSALGHDVVPQRKSGDVYKEQQTLHDSHFGDSCSCPM